MGKKKNGEIELLRFLFSMIIVIFHFNSEFKFGIFVNGGFCVEFFFLVTGVLLGMSLKKVHIEKREIPDYTYRFVGKKIASFYPYYIMVVAVLHLLLYRFIVLKDSVKDLAKVFLYNIPRLLFFDCAGFRLSQALTIRVDWYLSAMVLAIIILVPVLLYNYEWGSKILFPIAGVFGLGVFFANYGSLNATWKLVNSVLTSELTRGLFEIALGVWCYELSLKLRECRFTRLSRICLTVLKWMCFAGVLAYTIGIFAEPKNTVIFFVLFLIGITICFSENSYNIPYNSFVGFLGRLSLLIYLSHMPLVECCGVWFGEHAEGWKIAVAVCLCPLVGCAVMYVTNFVMKQLKKIKYIFIES